MFQPRFQTIVREKEQVVGDDFGWAHIFATDTKIKCVTIFVKTQQLMDAHKSLPTSISFPSLEQPAKILFFFLSSLITNLAEFIVGSIFFCYFTCKTESVNFCNDSLQRALPNQLYWR